jgi:hypothetical protein
VRSPGSDRFEIAASGDVSLLFRPLYPPGTHILEVRAGDVPIEFEVQFESGGLRVQSTVPFSRSLYITVDHSDEPAVVPPVWDSPLGSESAGLRVLSFVRDGLNAILVVEGKPGRSYSLGITNLKRIKSVAGAELSSEGLTINFPAADDEYITYTVRMALHE